MRFVFISLQETHFTIHGSHRQSKLCRVAVGFVGNIINIILSLKKDKKNLAEFYY